MVQTVLSHSYHNESISVTAIFLFYDRLEIILRFSVIGVLRPFVLSSKQRCKHNRRTK